MALPVNVGYDSTQLTPLDMGMIARDNHAAFLIAEVSPDLPALTFVAYTVGTQLRVQWGRVVTNTSTLLDATRYVLSGTGAPTITSVTYFSSYVVLGYTGSFTVGQSYTLTVASETAVASGDLTSSSAGSSAFTATASSLPALTFAAYTIGSELRVQWGRAVTSTAALLTSSNYTLSGTGIPTITGVTSYGTYVVLSYSGSVTAGQSYTLNVASGTATSTDGVQNAGGSTSFTGTLSQPFPALGFAVYTIGSELRVQWGRAVTNTGTLLTASRYTLSGPGSPVVTGVSYHSTYVVLTYSGKLTVAQSYTLTVAAGTAVSSEDGVSSSAGVATFLGTLTDVPPALEFVAFTEGSTLRVQWGRQVNSNSTLLDPTRYVIAGTSPPTVTSVTYYANYLLLGYSGSFTPGGNYTLTIAASTAVAMGDGTANLQSTSAFIGTLAEPHPALVFAAYTVGSELRVQWGRAVDSTTALLTASNYTISGGPTITGVAYHTTYVVLTYSGALVPGQSYLLTVAANTATSTGDGTKNALATASFTGTASSAPPALTFVAYTVGTQLRVHWGRPVLDTLEVRQAERYILDGPSDVEVSSVSFTSEYVVLNCTGAFLPGYTYTLTVASGTATAEDGTQLEEATSSFLGVDSTPPVVSYEPVPGTAIDPASWVKVTVSDPAGLRTVLVTVEFPNTSLAELVHDGTEFKSNYKGISTLSSTQGTREYLVRRRGGWPASPHFMVYAADAAGNEV